MKIFKGQKVYLMDDDFSTATGVVEENGKIIETGNFEELVKKYPEAEKIMTYENDYLYPGFVEPHSHPMLTSYFLGNCTLIDFKHWDFGKYGVAPACLTPEDMMNRLEKEVAKKEKDSFLFFGYNKQRHGTITAKELDQLEDQKPVVLLYGTGHGAVMNTCSMEKFGFNKIPKETFGCGLTEDGNYNGVFTETAYMPYISYLAPILYNNDNLEKGKNLYLENAKVNGIIATAEYMGGGTSGLENEIEFYQGFSNEDYPIHMSFLTNYQHVNNQFDNDNQKTFEYIDNMMSKYDTDDFKIMKALKFFFDGAVIDHQIMLSEPLTNGEVGKWNYDFKGHNIETFVEDFLPFWKNGYDFYIHSQGDLSQLTLAKKLKELLTKAPRDDYKMSIQHFAFSNDEFFEFVRANNLSISISALPAYMDIWPMWDKAGLYPKHFLTQNFLRLKDVTDDDHFDLSIHSDACNMPTRPLYGVYKAVTRKDDTETKVKDDRPQNIDLITGIRAITIEAAKQNRNENLFGSIEPGKRASFVVFEKDLFDPKNDYENLKQNVKHLVINGTYISLS
ncbi:amidohydrolase family protein [Bacillus cytotoxicus]|uniref:amidohydrolase family protein n=1 Tax=Bacillus cytotoxicus TaxID=580165 RepID=UPI003D7EEE5D